MAQDTDIYIYISMESTSLYISKMKFMLQWGVDFPANLASML
jgi:hypothetical protein